MRFLERPNLFAPAGSDRDVARIMKTLAQGRGLLTRQRYDCFTAPSPP
jgi:hypothetical protein